MPHLQNYSTRVSRPRQHAESGDKHAQEGAGRFGLAIIGGAKNHVCRATFQTVRLVDRGLRFSVPARRLTREVCGAYLSASPWLSGVGRGLR